MAYLQQGAEELYHSKHSTVPTCGDPNNNLLQEKWSTLLHIDEDFVILLSLLLSGYKHFFLL